MIDDLLPPTPERIKAARLAVNQSMEEAAATVWRSRAHWWRCEAGKSEMRKDTWELYLVKTGQRAAYVVKRPVGRPRKDR